MTSTTFTRLAGRILAPAVLALTFSAAASATNILVNPGFEDGVLDPWFQDLDLSPAGEDWNATMADANTGSWSATDTGNKSLRQDFAAVLTDDILEVSFWARHPDPNVSLMAYTFFYDDGSEEQNFINTVGGGWEFFDVTAELDAGKNLNGFRMFGNSTGCDANCARTFIDDVTIRVAQVPAPAPLALLGLGLLALGLRRTMRT